MRRMSSDEISFCLPLCPFAMSQILLGKCALYGCRVFWLNYHNFTSQMPLICTWPKSVAIMTPPPICGKQCDLDVIQSKEPEEEGLALYLPSKVAQREKVGAKHTRISVVAGGRGRGDKFVGGPPSHTKATVLQSMTLCVQGGASWQCVYFLSSLKALHFITGT